MIVKTLTLVAAALVVATAALFLSHKVKTFDVHLLVHRNEQHPNRSS